MAVTIALLGSIGSAPAMAQTDLRQDVGAAVVARLNRGQSQPTLEALRSEFPFLADSLQNYALGEVWARDGLDDQTRQLMAVAIFAALGDQALLRVHAQYALNIGVTRERLKEAVYLVTVPAGFPRAIAAAQTLSALFEEQAH